MIRHTYILEYYFIDSDELQSEQFFSTLERVREKAEKMLKENDKIDEPIQIYVKNVRGYLDLEDDIYRE